MRSLRPRPWSGQLVARAEILERYAVGRETFFDCRVAGQTWKGVVPEGSEGGGESAVRLAVEKVFYFAPDGARLRIG